MSNNIINYRSLTEQVCDYLRKNIEDGLLKPGDPIDEKNLCNKLNISRTPIREALLILQAEGFITILPRRRIYVNELGIKDIEEIFQILGPLEGEAALRAVDKMTEKNVQEFEDLTKKMKQALERGDYYKYYEINGQIHDFFLRLNDNKTLNRIVRLLKRRYYSSPLVLKKDEILNKKIPQLDAQAMEYHLKMVDMCKKRDKKGLRRLLRDYHWSFERRRPIFLSYYSNDKG